MENKFIVSLSPHVHGGDSIQKNMYGVLIALFPAFIVSLLFFGLGALIVQLLLWQPASFLNGLSVSTC